MNAFRRLFLGAYVLFCLAVTMSMPVNKFEWMLDEPGAKEGGLTFCTLPLDDGAETRIVTFAILVPLWLACVFLSLRQRRVHPTAWVAAVLTLVWCWRFFVHYPMCP